MLQKICRLCPNSADWRRPTSDKSGENKDAYTAKFGFGFEEWLNREEWLLSGYPGVTGQWRYVHIQGMMTKHNAYEGQEVRILFYVKEPGQEPQAVAILESAIVLDAQEATWAAKQFTNKKWLHLMHAEVEAIGGNTDGLPPISAKGNALTWENPLFYANVRFLPENLRFFEPRKPIEISAYYYGKALDWNGIISKDDCKLPPVPVPQPPKGLNTRTEKELSRFSEDIRTRRESAGKNFIPRQAPIQNALAVQLHDYYKPRNGIVTCEDERVDIKLVAPDGTITFIEIKPASTARQAIRQSIGQLLEYSHYPDTQKAQRLIIVSDAEPQQEDFSYLSNINQLYALSIRYVHWPLKAKELPESILAVFIS